MSGEWNPRYVAYAEAHGFDPDTMLAADEVLWPGGKMCGFMVWIGERWREWRESRGVGRNAVLGSDDHADFDAMIGARR